MISLLKTVTELERLEQLRTATAEWSWMAIRSASQYAVEVNPHDLAEFRRHLQGIEERLRKAANPEELRESQASFRGELREYRDRAHEHLARLQRELEATASAMAAFVSGVSSNSASHEDKVRQQVARLKAIAESQNLTAARSAILSAAGEISTSLEEIRRSNQTVIAQLQDEIRLLHEKAEEERRVLFTDPASSAWNRQKIDQRLEELLRLDESFCVLFLGIRNLNLISRRHSRTVVEGVLKGLIRRLHAIVGPDALIARWSEHEFAVVLDLEPTDVVPLSAQVSLKLSGSYAVQENGFAHDVAVQITTGVVDYPAKSDAGAFRRKVALLSAALKISPVT